MLILPIEGSCLLHGEISSQLKKGCLYALDLPPGGGGGGHSRYYTLLGIWLMILTHRGEFPR